MSKYLELSVMLSFVFLRFDLLKVTKEKRIAKRIEYFKNIHRVLVLKYYFLTNSDLAPVAKAWPTPASKSNDDDEDCFAVLQNCISR